MFITLATKNLIKDIRTNKSNITSVTLDTTPIGRTAQVLHDKLTKYAKLFIDATKKLEELHRKVNLVSTSWKRRALMSIIQPLDITRNTYRNIFNLELKQARNYKDLKNQWWDVKPFR